VPRDYPTIQAAISRAQDGDQVALEPGTYRESFHFAGKVIRPRSVAETVILGAGGFGAAVEFCSGEGRGSVLDELTVSEDPPGRTYRGLRVLEQPNQGRALAGGRQLRRSRLCVRPEPLWRGHGAGR